MSKQNADYLWLKLKKEWRKWNPALFRTLLKIGLARLKKWTKRRKPVLGKSRPVSDIAFHLIEIEKLNAKRFFSRRTPISRRYTRLYVHVSTRAHHMTAYDRLHVNWHIINYDTIRVQRKRNLLGNQGTIYRFAMAATRRCNV